MSRYPRDVKDRMWKEILIDEYCFNTDNYEQKINDLIQIEKWSYIVKVNPTTQETVLEKKK